MKIRKLALRTLAVLAGASIALTFSGNAAQATSTNHTSMICHSSLRVHVVSMAANTQTGRAIAHTASNGHWRVWNNASTAVTERHSNTGTTNTSWTFVDAQDIRAHLQICQ